MRPLRQDRANVIAQGIHGHRQRGLIAILLVVGLLLGGAVFFWGVLTNADSERARERKTAEALALAKSALIAYAVSLPVYASNAPANRLGDLPCPDLDDDGNAEPASCGNAAGTTGQARRLGRLPWRTLGLPDLRDGDGERLWYAVSSNFKNNTRTNCNTPGAAGCLNSDTRGTITIRNNTGAIIHDAAQTDPSASGVVAVVLSPGAVLRRQGASSTQDRTCTGSLCTAQGICNVPVTNAPKCHPANYLDTSGTEDNADFVDGSGTNGFIHGLIRDGNGNTIVNDRLLVVTYQDVMPQLEKRVAAETLRCLNDYAAANNGRYPWAAPVADITGTFDDVTNTLFGRIADRPLSRTQLGTVDPTTPTIGPALQTACNTPAPSASCMSPYWQPPCQLPTDGTAPSWWNNWKLQVFYAVADAFKPMITFTQPTPGTALPTGIPLPTGCPSCLTVNPPSAVADKRIVVIMSGRRMPTVAGGQPRASGANQQNIVNYLEGGNGVLPTFTQLDQGPTFNDLLRYK